MEAEDIRKKFAELPARSLAWSALFTLSLLLYAIQAVEKLLKGTGFVNSLILSGVASSNGQPAVTLWLSLLISVLIALPILLIILLAHSIAAAKLQREKALLAEQLEREKTQRMELSKNNAERCFNETMFAASVIRSQQTPDASHTVKILSNIHVEYRIQKDFSVKLVRRFTIAAAAPSLHFWETSIRPTTDASPVEYLNEIKFQVFDVTDPAHRRSMTYLQTQNDPRHKCVCVFFLPRLLQSDPSRQIEISFTWPQYLAQLKRTGREDLFQTFNSAGPTKIAIVDVWFEDGNGGSTGLDVVSTYPHQRLPLSETGWSGFRYQAENLPPGRQEHKLSATWTKA